MFYTRNIFLSLLFFFLFFFGKMSFIITGVSLLQAFFIQTENKLLLFDTMPCKGLKNCFASQQDMSSRWLMAATRYILGPGTITDT